MKKLERELRRALERQGITEYELTHPAHYKFSFMHNGKKQIVVTSSSPKGAFSVNAFERDVRRIISQPAPTESVD